MNALEDTFSYKCQYTFTQMSVYFHLMQSMMNYLVYFYASFFRFFSIIGYYLVPCDIE